MPVPTYDQFIEPLLRYLANHPEGIAAGDVHEALADEMKLTPEDRAELLPSAAQAVYKNRIGWAHDRLKRLVYSTSPRRGWWQITPEGLAFAKTHSRLSNQLLEQLASIDKASRLKPKAGETATVPTVPVTDAAVGKVSPEERIEAAVAELRESVGRDLLERIGRAPPAFFEQLVLNLLHAMGYGTERSDLQRVGGSGDGGIDGIISLDKLGLEKVYIQAKRWKNAVGSPEIQGFMGALQLQGASKGVFITTSTFTKEARNAAGRARGSIVLVDGELLASLMIDHGVAVSHKPLRVPKVDGDYFDEG